MIPLPTKIAIATLTARVIVTPTARVMNPLPMKKMLETAFQIVSTLDTVIYY